MNCIKCLSEAITIMVEMCKEEMCSKVDHISHQLGVAYILRALCNQEALCKEAEPDSKPVLEDVKAALKIWLSIYCVDCNEEEGKLYPLSDNIMVLLYNILDLIQMKDFMELSNDAYKLLIRMFKLKSVSVQKWLTLLWESRRLIDTLCVSPVNEAFILNSEISELSTIDFWISNLQGNQSSLLGFQNKFSFLFANSHLNPYDHSSSFQTDITIVEVREAALKLISNETKDSHSSFLAGYIYIDISQRLITNGRLVEALSFANEAHRLHFDLFQEKFRNVLKKPSKIRLKKSVAMEVMLFDSISGDLKSNYLSPWKVMQSYLGSTLQVGLIYEMMGNRMKAETYFRQGRNISHSFHFPLFTFAFSYHLGSMYVKKRNWDSAENELQCAKKILESSTTFCCSKCQIIFEITLNESLGDLCKSKPNTCEWGISEETAVKNWYTLALVKLNLSKWTNSLSCLEEGSDATATDAKCPARKTCSCSIMNEVGEDKMESVKSVPKTKIGCSFSKMKCWHCLSSEVIKSGLLDNFINLKWEFV